VASFDKPCGFSGSTNFIFNGLRSDCYELGCPTDNHLHFLPSTPLLPPKIRVNIFIYFLSHSFILFMILFTICPGLQRKNNSPVYFFKKKRVTFFFLCHFHKGKKCFFFSLGFSHGEFFCIEPFK